MNPQRGHVWRNAPEETQRSPTARVFWRDSVSSGCVCGGHLRVGRVWLGFKGLEA
jgi:hypothetical protein